METPGANTVTKRDLVQRIADQTGQTKVLVRDIVQSFLDEVATELVHGNRLEFRKFGVFASARVSELCDCLRQAGGIVAEGQFGAKMEVELVNQGPATYLLEL